MKQEFDFFIEENLPILHQWAEETKCRGGLVVGSSHELITILQERTTPGDEIICKLSGAWLDFCIARSVQNLLYSRTQENILPKRKIVEITVDISKCITFGEHIKIKTSDEKRKIFESTQLDNTDPRLKILI